MIRTQTCRNWIRVIAINICLLVLGLLAVELYFRIMSPRIAATFGEHFSFDPASGWVMKRGAILRSRNTYLWNGKQYSVEAALSINSRGFNFDEFRWQKDPSKAKILFVGDSFVGAFQTPRESNFATRVGQQISQIRGRPTEVWNVGVSGWALDNELAFFDSELKGLRPEVVVWVIFLGNDTLDSLYPSYRKMYRGSSEIRSLPKPHFRFTQGADLVPLSVMENLAARSEIVFRVYMGMSKRIAADEHRQLDELRKPHQALGEFNASMMAMGGIQLHLENLVAHVQAARGAVQEVGGAFSVVLIPNTNTVSAAPSPGDALSKYTKDLENYEYVLRELSRLKIPTLGVREFLLAQLPPQSKVTYEKDGHFNVRVHELLAPRIGDLIQESLQ